MFITQIQLTSYWYWIPKLCLTYLLDLIVFYWDEINIRLIIVKCTIQWYLGHSHCYAATTPSSSKILSLTTNKVLCPQHLWQPPVSQSSVFMDLPILDIFLIFLWREGPLSYLFCHFPCHYSSKGSWNLNCYHFLNKFMSYAKKKIIKGFYFFLSNLDKVFSLPNCPS